MTHTEIQVRVTTERATVPMVFTLIASIALSIITSIRFINTIIKPAEKLTRTVRRIAQGHKMRTDLPIFVVNVGNLSPEGVADMDYFLQQVKEQGIPMTYVYFAAGYDGFDYKINTSGMELSPEQMTEGIKIIQQAVDFMKKESHDDEQ
jgi:methyl-accepting chemotaxis protein